jgi:hypothetical protein
MRPFQSAQREMPARDATEMLEKRQVDRCPRRRAN